MFISVLAKMVDNLDKKDRNKTRVHSKNDQKNQENDDDQKIAEVLIDLQNREEYRLFKDQEITNKYVKI